MCVLIPFLPAVTAHKARHVNDLSGAENGMWSLVRVSF